MKKVQMTNPIMGGGIFRKRGTIVIVVLLLTLIIGISFAYWQVTLQQSNQNEVTSSCFEFELLEQNDINLEKAYPMTDEEGKKLTPYEFTIRNICDTATNYQINLEILNTTTFEDLSYMKVMLNDEISILTNKEPALKTLDDATKSYKLQTGFFDIGQERTFELRLWMDEDTPTDKAYMNKSLFSKITITAGFIDNLNNEIKVTPISQNERYGLSESFLINVESEKFNLIAMSEDGENWVDLENTPKNMTLERTYNKNGNYKMYFKDELEHIKEATIQVTKIDDKSPIADFTISNIGSSLIIDASSSKDNETSITKYYYSFDGESWHESTVNSYSVTDNGIIYGVATKAIESIKNLVAYLKVEDECGNISEVKEVNVARTGSNVSSLAYDGTVDNNLRYVGNSPYNYVSFNGEKWRIVGVMYNIDDGTGKKEARVKLARNESIGSYSWDSSVSTVNSGNGVNEWSQADAMKLMNPGYENEEVGGSLYWNRTSGKCYNGTNNANTACDFTSTGLTSEARNMVGDAVWHTSYIDYVKSVSTIQAYTQERGNRVVCTNCSDGVSRTTSWTGKVALMYPSDYGYTRKNTDCWKQTIFDCGESSSCRNDNWLSASWNFTLAPFNSLYGITPIAAWNAADQNIAARSSAIYPMLYLKSDVKIISGTGDMNNPFVLSMD